MTAAAVSGLSPPSIQPSCRFSADRRWFIETVDGEERRFRISKVIYEGRTAFQEVAIVESDEFGTLLVIDGETQSAEDDEYIYHEALVHPAMLAHPDPRRVLIVGGGEGATLREVLRHRTVERAVMVDIDGELIELARRYLQRWHQGAFDDPRTDLRIGDGMAFLQSCEDRFDVVIVDICDYVESTAAAGLYSDAFTGALRNVLAPGGIAVVQAGELGRWTYASHVTLARMLENAFGRSIPYSTFVESFWSEWSFLLTGDPAPAMAHAAPSLIDAAVASRRLSQVLRFYDGATHQRMFHLAKDVRDAIAAARAA